MWINFADHPFKTETGVRGRVEDNIDPSNIPKVNTVTLYWHPIQISPNGNFISKSKTTDLYIKGTIRFLGAR